MELKPQDTLIAVKYWSLNRSQKAASVRSISEAIAVSASEVSKGTRRLVASRLAVERSEKVLAETGALLEWLCYGIRYAYPQERVGYGRGMATSWNCPVLKTEVVPPIPPMVWPMPGGNAEGELIKPIHSSIPFAATQDEQLYRAMSLLEAIRGAKPRELEIARRLMTELFRGV